MNRSLKILLCLAIVFTVVFYLPNNALFSQDNHEESSDSHAGHDHAPAKTVAADPHAGHDHDSAPEAAVVNPHAGHNHAPAPDATVGTHAGHDHASEAADPHAGHNHGPALEVGTMPIAELKAQDCEHSIKTIDCDECRYELGAVKITDQVKSMIKTTALEKSENSQEISFRGELEYDSQLFRTVTSVVPGIIASMTVRKGDVVQPGQPIAIIESRELSHIALELQKQISELELANKKLAREEMLHQKKVGSLQSVQEARATKDLAQLEVKCSKESLAIFGLSKKEIEAIAAGRGESIQQGRLNIFSPVQGRIVKVNVSAGSAVNEQQPLVDIVNIKQLFAIGQIQEADIAAVIAELKKRNISGFIKTQAFPGLLFPVKAVSADTSLNSTTRTMAIQLTVKNQDELLRPGMFIEGTLQIGASLSKATLPNTAVLEDDGKAFVFVKHSEEMFFRRDVTIESRNGDLVTIADGIADGDEVVIEGSFLLKSDILRAKMGAGCAH